ncbi:MAG: SRPBCC domain-containing protein [Acidimicrobiia bacterium]|nr:SRPBCC domain-containing protein [Acidimicrobiia bacterium]
MSKPVHVYQVFINAPTEIVWNAIVDGDMTVQYFYGTRIASTWEPGAEVIYTYPDGAKASEGEVLSIDPGKRLEMTFLPLWDPELTAEGAAREVWLVEDADGATKLTVETYDITEGGKIHTDFASGWPFIISGLKTLVETGQPMQMAGPDGS